MQGNNYSMIQVMYLHRYFLAMKSSIRLITVLALWIAVSATTHEYMEEKERMENLSILTEEISEHEFETNLLENIDNDFFEGAGDYNHRAPERTGKLFSDH